MSQLSKVLRSMDGDRLTFFCPGCHRHHSITVGNANSWNWNSNVDKPTFTPSVLVKSGHYAESYDGTSCWCTHNEEFPDQVHKFTCEVCHSFVTDGRIQFLNDCTHALKGKTVDLPTTENKEDV